MKAIPTILSPLFLGILVSTIAYPIRAQEGEKEPVASVARIENSRTGANVPLAELVDSLEQVDVIFLGEQHDNDSGHDFQLDVIKELVNRGLSIAITTEQFERDVQGALNDYLIGRLSEDEFLSVSRPWSNYAKHYRPIVEFAKEKKIPVIAANIPRRIATIVSQAKQPSPEEMALMPRQTNATKNAYWQKFKATMEGHMGTDGESKLEAFFNSQCLKDDAMAESITDYLAINSHEPKIVVHLCGHFHSDYGLGTVSRVLQRRPLTRFSVITMESVENERDEKTRAILSSRSHYTFFTVKNHDPENVPNEQSK